MTQFWPVKHKGSLQGLRGLGGAQWFQKKLFSWFFFLSIEQFRFNFFLPAFVCSVQPLSFSVPSSSKLHWPSLLYIHSHLHLGLHSETLWNRLIIQKNVWEKPQQGRLLSSCSRNRKLIPPYGWGNKLSCRCEGASFVLRKLTSCCPPCGLGADIVVANHVFLMDCPLYYDRISIFVSLFFFLIN